MDFGFKVEDLRALQCLATSCKKSREFVYCLEGFIPQPLNVKFGGLNTTALEKYLYIRDISSILYSI